MIWYTRSTFIFWSRSFSTQCLSQALHICREVLLTTISHMEIDTPLVFLLVIPSLVFTNANDARSLFDEVLLFWSSHHSRVALLTVFFLFPMCSPSSTSALVMARIRRASSAAFAASACLTAWMIHARGWTTVQSRWCTYSRGREEA